MTAMDFRSNKLTRGDYRRAGGSGCSSQRRYVHYWQKSLSFPDGFPPEVNIPEPITKVLQQIRIYNTRNIETIFIVVSEMHKVPGQRYRPSRDICRNFCKKVNDVGIVNLGHFYSFLEEDHEGHNSEVEGSDENSSYDFYFDRRIKVTGDLCVTFYERNIGGRLFYACFNTAFIEDNLLKFSITELDKVGNKAKSIAGPEFRVELLFGPDNPNDGEDGCNSDLTVDTEDTKELKKSVGDSFIERPKHKGMVVNGWVNEEETISHTAIGAFVSHCGWNLVMKASARGNQYLAWLQSGDQKESVGGVETAGLGGRAGVG
ncbi:phosphatidylinositol 3,4,5-trisphosphate 3-phosphatase and protein-tyrosine-phosphatase PTEN1-like protein [Tanacetum coccineum]